MTSRRRPASPPPRRRRGGFTLIELLVVIGIILLLAAILMPVVSSVRKAAYNASTQSQMQRIMTACQSYYHDFNSYPGPVANTFLSGGSATTADPLAPTNVTGKITSSENLVLGLLGYLDLPKTAGLPPAYNAGGQTNMKLPPGPPPHDVLSLNPLHPARYSYIDYSADELSAGNMTNAEPFNTLAPGSTAPGQQAPSDSNVPEFLDRFPEHLAILYVRAFPGGSATPLVTGTDTTGGTTVQYNFNELKDYVSIIRASTPANNPGFYRFTNANLMKLRNTFYNNGNGNLANDEAIPYNGFYSATPAAGQSFYFNNPNIGGAAVRGKDGFLLISAGVDRTYGTIDDTIITP